MTVIRADTVGSLLRPSGLHAARSRYAAGEIDAAALRGVEDEAIAGIVAYQENLGLPVVTDGEFRRENWWIDFVRRLEGVEIIDGDGKAFANNEALRYVPKSVRIARKLRASGPILVDDFRFVAKHSRVIAKISIPSPTRLHFHGGRRAISAETYPDIEAFFADVAAIFRREIAALEGAGCRYIQIDDPLLSYFLDPKLRAEVVADGDDPDHRLHRYIRLINDCISERSSETTVGIHICRGNARSTWLAEGTYEGLAETCFAQLEVDRFLLEYDDERSGSFEPLRFIPKGRQVVLGLVTTKGPKLEDKNFLKRRLDEAARLVDPAHLALSPQCGFASVVEGNLITEEHQRAKLALVVETAGEYWGKA
jgi:5-methyltetrahydropteroyltriglutamate--homocysteine methyltransferase